MVILATMELKEREEILELWAHLEEEDLMEPLEQ